MINITLRTLFFIGLLSSAFAAQAAVYKCVIKGVATFSQFPCGTDAKEINIKAASSPPTESSDQANNEPDLAVESYLKIQQIDRRINELQLKLKELDSQLAEDLEKVSYMSQDSANRLGAASIQDAINQQSTMLTQRVKEQKTAITEHIKKLEEAKQMWQTHL